MNQATPQAPPPSGFIPMTVGQILDRIFRLFRANVRLFLQIASVPAASMFAMYGTILAALYAFGGFPMPHHAPNPFRMVAILIFAGLVAGVAFGLLHAIFEPAGIHAALQADRGRKITFLTAYGVALSNAGRYLWLMALRILWIGLPILLCYAIIAAVTLTFRSKGAVAHPGIYFAAFPLLFLLYSGSLVYATITGLRLALAMPACIAESVGAMAALRRSLTLTRDAKARIFVVMLAIGGAGYVAIIVFQFVAYALIGGGALLLFLVHLHIPPAALMIGAVLLGVATLGAMFLLCAALTAGYTISFAVLYHEQRLRIEGVSRLAPAEEPA